MCVYIATIHMSSVHTPSIIHSHRIRVTSPSLLPKHLDASKGAPLRLPKATIGSVPCACVLVCALCI